MACASIAQLLRACGAEGTPGGLSKAYIVGFSDLVPLSGSVTGEVYTITAGMYSEIGLASGKHFVEVGLLKDTAGINSEWTIAPEKGNSYSTQTFTLNLAGLTGENKTFVDSVMNRPVAVLVKTKSNTFYAVGLNGLLELTGRSESTGTANDDMVGYTLTFTGTDNKGIIQVDPTLVPELIG